MKMNDAIWIVAGIVVIAIIVKNPSIAGAFATDVASVPGRVGGYITAGRESFR